MDWNLYVMIQSPAFQALLFLLATPVLILVARPKTTDRAWVLALYPFVLFLIVNAAMLWTDDRPWRYFFYSIGVALVYLIFISIIMSGLLRILKLKSSGESAMGFLVLIYQPFALLLVMAVKWAATNWF